MRINDDIKCIAEFLLEIPSVDNKVITTIYSFNFTSRHPDFPFYKNSNSVPKMINDGVLKLIETNNKGQPSSDSSTIHYFTNYKVSFKPEDIKNYLEKVKSEQKPNKIQNEEIYHLGQLNLNVSQGIICYDNNSIIEISKETECIKFLIFLFDNRRVVEYVEIAKHLDLNSYHVGCTNQDMARDVQFIKRDLLSFLKNKVGMPEKETKNIIITKRSLGLKLHQ